MKLDTNGDNKVTADEFFAAYNKGECDDFLNGPWMHMKNKRTGRMGINWEFWGKSYAQFIYLRMNCKRKFV